MEQKPQNISQNQKLYNLLQDGLPHNTIEILHTVYNLPDEKGIARISARIYDVQKKFGVIISGKHDKDNPAIYWYQMKIAPKIVLEEKSIWSPQHFINLEQARQTSLF